jgi:hypothetical protein
VEETDDVLEVLRTQSGATRRLIRNTGEVFSALSERQGQLRELIQSSERVWTTIAGRDAELADTFRVLPTFLRESRVTTRRLTRFAEDTDPLIDQLRPAARQLSPLLIDLDAAAPDLRGFFTKLGPLTRVSRRGLPATSEALDNTRPVLGRLESFLREVTPIVDYLGLYRREIAAFFANDAAVTQAIENGNSGERHYLRTQNPMTPETMAAFSRRIAMNRSNPYIEPGGYLKLGSERRLETFGSYLCTANPNPQSPPTPTAQLPADQVAVLDYFTFGGTKNRNAAPPCDPQAPLGPRTNGGSGMYPRLGPLP